MISSHWQDDHGSKEITLALSVSLLDTKIAFTAITVNARFNTVLSAGYMLALLIVQISAATL
jgi:hypothetical protein